MTPQQVTDKLMQSVLYASPENLEAVIRSKLPQYVKKAIANDREQSAEIVEGPIESMEAKAEKIDQSGGDAGPTRNVIWWLKDRATKIREAQKC